MCEFRTLSCYIGVTKSHLRESSELMRFLAWKLDTYTTYVRTFTFATVHLLAAFTKLANRAGSSGRSLAPEGMHVSAADVLDNKFSFSHKSKYRRKITEYVVYASN